MGTVHTFRGKYFFNSIGQLLVGITVVYVFWFTIQQVVNYKSFLSCRPIVWIAPTVKVVPAKSVLLLHEGQLRFDAHLQSGIRLRHLGRHLREVPRHHFPPQSMI